MTKNIIFFSLILLISCAKKEIEVKEIPFQFGVNNSGPNLVSQDGVLTLSWIKSTKDKEAILQYSQFKKGKWEPPKNISSGLDWFVNWADFPANAVNGGFILTSYLKKSDNSTYSYDVILNLKKLTGESIRKDFLLNTDGIKAEHGFVSMIPNPEGGFFVTWLDGRNTVETENNNSEGNLRAMTIRVAEISVDGTIFNEKELDDSTCDCCQTSISMAKQGPVIVYRKRSKEEIRDIYITRRIDGVWSEPKPVFDDGWKINGCPVNGPKIASNNKNVAVSWFTMENNEPTVNFSFSLDGGANFKNPIKVSEATALGRVDILFLNPEEVLVSYIENDKNGTFLKCRKIDFDGEISKDFIISKIDASRSTGVPQLEILRNEIYAVWTVSDGDKSQLKSVRFSIDDLRFSQ